jgi:hypothetical protein
VPEQFGRRNRGQHAHGTHALTLLYHLAKHGAYVLEIKDIKLEGAFKLEPLLSKSDHEKILLMMKTWRG